MSINTHVRREDRWDQADQPPELIGEGNSLVVKVSRDLTLIDVAGQELLSRADYRVLRDLAYAYPESGAGQRVGLSGDRVAQCRLEELVWAGQRWIQIHIDFPAVSEDTHFDLEDLGHSAAWGRMVDEVRRADSRRVLFAGDQGTGKLTVATEWAGGGAEVFEVARLVDDLARLRQIAGDTEAAIVIRRLDHLDFRVTQELIGLLGDARCRIAGTLPLAALAVTKDIAGLFGAMILVPSLQDRPEDIPAAVVRLSRQIDPAREVHWMPDALNVLVRTSWSHGFSSLRETVREVLLNTRFPYITANDLPENLRERAQARVLPGLADAEATAIRTAMIRSGGNKSTASDLLGISRSTLYRKLREFKLSADGHGFHSGSHIKTERIA